jgi:hypothetical protein
MQKSEPKVARRAQKAELELEQVHSPPAHSVQASGHWEPREWLPQESLPQAQPPREPPYWPEEPQPLEPQVQAALEQPQAQLASAQQELLCPSQVPSREPQASAVLPQEPWPQVPPPDASAPLSPPHPWLLFPPWPWPLALLPRPLHPECVSAPSPRRPRGWNSSASSFQLRRTRPAGQ